MRIFAFLLITLGLVGCWSEIMPIIEGVNNVVEGGAGMGIPYFGVASVLSGFLVEFVRGRLEKRSLLKHAGALYRGVDAHLKSLPPEEQERAKKLMEDTVKKIVGNKRLGKAKKILDLAKSFSKIA